MMSSHTRQRNAETRCSQRKELRTAMLTLYFRDLLLCLFLHHFLFVLNLCHLSHFLSLCKTEEQELQTQWRSTRTRMVTHEWQRDQLLKLHRQPCIYKNDWFTVRHFIYQWWLSFFRSPLPFPPPSVSELLLIGGSSLLPCTHRQKSHFFYSLYM